MTVTLRAPVVAVDDTVMFAVSCVELFFITEFTVMPAPEKVTVPPKAPLAPPKPVPAMVTVWPVAPWPRDAGFTDVTGQGRGRR